MTIQLTEFQEIGGIAAPPVSPAGSARIYFDAVANSLRMSENGGAYEDFLTAANVGWTDDGTVVRLVDATDQVAIGAALGTPNRKLTVVETGTNEGVRVQAEALGNNVLDALVTGEAAARLQVTTNQVRFGDGIAPTDVGLWRAVTQAGAYIAADTGLQLAGDIVRLNGGMTIAPHRTVAGVADAVLLRAGVGVLAGPNLAQPGGLATVRGGDGIANGIAQAAGGDGQVVGGQGASGVGGAPARGGFGVVRGGGGSVNNGDGGDVRLEPGVANGSGVNGQIVCVIAGQAATPHLVPRVDAEGNIGLANRRWGSIRAVQITSGAYLEEEVFDEEFLPLADKLQVLQRELDANPDGDSVRHLARITMVCARAVLELGSRAAA